MSSMRIMIRSERRKQRRPFLVGHVPFPGPRTTLKGIHRGRMLDITWTMLCQKSCCRARRNHLGKVKVLFETSIRKAGGVDNKRFRDQAMRAHDGWKENALERQQSSRTAKTRLLTDMALVHSYRMYMQDALFVFQLRHIY